jgi:GAF domain-containing protein
MNADLANKRENFKDLLREIERIVAKNADSTDKLMEICKLLKARIAYYDWAGFYLADGAEKELYLGPYIGAPTEHTRIPFGKGICGQAAQTEKTFVVQDVSKETNYLSCSADVRSEIVVPIFKEGKIAGEIDIDSHRVAPFTAEDRDFLETVARLVVPII